jgi:hypothetical protein
MNERKTKFEARNPKFETNDQMSKIPKTSHDLSFGFGIFRFRICFGFRYSNFGFWERAQGGLASGKCPYFDVTC